LTTPGGELLVRLDEAVAPHAHQDGAELVEDVVGPIRLGRNFRVQPDQRLTQVILDQDFVRLAREILRTEVVPPRPEIWPWTRASAGPTKVW
jgi:hypothetical protein